MNFRFGSRFPKKGGSTQQKEISNCYPASKLYTIPRKGICLFQYDVTFTMKFNYFSIGTSLKKGGFGIFMQRLVRQLESYKICAGRLEKLQSPLMSLHQFLSP